MKHRLAPQALMGLVALAASSVASAAFIPYRVLVVDFGGTPGAIGRPITWTGPGDNTSLTIPAGGLFAPFADSIDTSPRLRWDNYFMFDPQGASFGGDPSISGDGYSALSPSGSFGPAFGAGTLGGVLYNVEPGPVGGRYAGPDGRLYLVNITLRAGSSLPTTLGMYAGISEDGAPPSQSESNLSAVKFGVENAVAGVNLPSRRRYYLDWIATSVPAAELPPSFGPGVNYQIFIQQLDPDVPAPGPVGLAAVVGAAASSRRRFSKAA